MNISQINIYPIKSLKGISVESATVEDRGLKFDRRWLLVDPDNKFITQREVPKMATVGLEVQSDGLKASSNGSSIEVPLEPATGEKKVIEIWNDKVEAEFYPQEIHNWFTGAIGAECQLASMPASSDRTVEEGYSVRDEDVVSFADEFPFLLIGEGSLSDLNSRLDTPLPMNRFRPNFVVAGLEPFEEDTWKRIRIGDTEFHIVKPCARCVQTTVDQEKGEKAGKEPLATLATFRNYDGKVLFGQNLIAEKAGGSVKVGDKIEVIETK